MSLVSNVKSELQVNNTAVDVTHLKPGEQALPDHSAKLSTRLRLLIVVEDFYIHRSAILLNLR
jgi:hypothetical protein